MNRLVGFYLMWFLFSMSASPQTKNSNTDQEELQRAAATNAENHLLKVDMDIAKGSSAGSRDLLKANSRGSQTIANTGEQKHKRRFPIWAKVAIVGGGIAGTALLIRHASRPAANPTFGNSVVSEK
jgi:hypothetical protein